MWLLHWEALGWGDEAVPAEAERTAHCLRKISSIAEAQRRGGIGDDVRPEVLMYAVMALANTWTALPQVVRMLMTGVADDTPKPGPRRIRLIGKIHDGEVRVARGGVAMLAAMFTREFVDDLRRARKEGTHPTVDDPARTL